MSADPYATGILGRPEPVERCAATGRPYERGHGAQSHAEQSARFIREQAAEADRPKEGEFDLQTGQPFDCSIGALPKSVQAAEFLAQAPPEFKARRREAFEAFRAIEPQGSA
jgi:hypothetical protein